MYGNVIKRVLDVVLSGIGLVVLSPVYMILAIAIKSESKGPVLFRQIRAGKHQRPFTIYKFRSMRTDTPNVPTYEMNGIDRYITKVGRFMRRTSMDELPQLINIFRGEMSVVGPRPVLLDESGVLDAREEVGANGIKPGLTGWAQVNGRNEISVERRAEYDGEYVQKMSFMLDARIFLLTAVQVLRRDGIEAGEELAVAAPTGVIVRKEEKPETFTPTGSANTPTPIAQMAGDKR